VSTRTSHALERSRGEIGRASFAKTGDPNYKGAPAEWPHFGHDAKSGEPRLQFDPGAKYEVVRSFRNEECKLWADYAKQ
jgi:hypothetical protein